MQDNDGYMWFGTDNGLSRFDGYEFKNFGPAEGLKNVVIFDLKIDEDGKLWILTMSGNIYICDQENIKPYIWNSKISSLSDKFNYATKFEIIRNNHIILHLNQYGIIEVNAKGVKIHNPGDKATIELKEYNNSVFFGNSSERDINPSNTDKIPREILHIHNCNSSNILLANKGANGWQRSAVKIRNNGYLVQNENHSYVIDNCKIINTYQSSLTLNCIYNSDNSDTWIGHGYQAGIRIYKTNFDIGSNNYTNVLAGYSISDIMKDSNGGLWITSLEQGVFFALSESQVYSTIPHSFQNQKLTSLINGLDKTFYVANWNGKVSKITNNTIETLPKRTYNDQPNSINLGLLFNCPETRARRCQP